MPRPRIADAEERLLIAGLSLFARRGCERVNSNAIARAAGVGIGTFYLHFANKYALLRVIEQRTLAALREARRQSDPGAGSEIESRVRATVRAAVEFAAAHPEAYRVCFGRERTAPAHQEPLVVESARPIADVLRARQRAGALDSGLDPELAARAYLAMEAGLLLWWLEDRTRAEPARLVETLTRAHPVAAGRA